MLKELIDEVSKRVEKAEGTTAVFNDKRYSAIDFSENNYHEIGASSGKTIVFVDGGNAELVRAPGLSLQMMRNAAVTIKGNKLVKSKKREFYVLAIEERKGEKTITSATIYSSESGKTEATTTEAIEAAKMCDAIRRASETKLAIEMLEHADMVVLDGTLEAQNDLEKRHIDGLRYEAIARRKTVAAVAKTTTLLTEKGSPFAAMLSQRKEGSWHYHPVAEISSDYHKAEMFFVKLHRDANHVFRSEVFKEQKSEIAATAAELKENARELTFPGYPYGLILADRLARVSEKEASYMKARLFAAAGKKWTKLKDNLAAMNAHEILNSM